MKYILGLMVLFAAHSYAGHLDKVCLSARQSFPNDPSRSVANPPSFSHDLILRRSLEAGAYVVESQSGEAILKSEQEWTALLKTNDLIWLTTASELEVYAITGEKLASYNYNPERNESWAARDIVQAGDLLVLTRGLAGLWAFNTKTRQTQWQTLLPELDSGTPIATAFDGEFLRVAMATAYEGGFTGVAKVSLLDGKVLANSPYDVIRSGVISIEATAVWYRDRLIINNGGWIHQMTKDQLESGKKLRPRWVAFQIAQNGDVMPHYMMLNGGFMIENDSVVGCGDYTTKLDGQFTRASKLFTVKLP